MMQSIPVGKAIGHVLAHDVTRIVPGQNKGPAFKKGHIIRKQDVETLLDEYYEARGWDPETGTPADEKLQELGLPTRST